MEGEGRWLPKGRERQELCGHLEGDREMEDKHTKKEPILPQGHPTAALPSWGLSQSFAQPPCPTPHFGRAHQTDCPSWGWGLSLAPWGA